MIKHSREMHPIARVHTYVTMKAFCVLFCFYLLFVPSALCKHAATCQTQGFEIGRCVNLMQCEPYYNLLMNSKTDPNVHLLLRKENCGFEGKYPKVCCPPTPDSLTVHSQTQAQTPERSANSLEEDYVLDFPEPPVCGGFVGTFKKVVGGDNAHLGTFPWMALLGYKQVRNVSRMWECGGTLISSKHVLTAAHCIHLRENQLYIVRLGELDLDREDEGATPIDVLIKTMIKHEQFNPYTHTNDIGVLVLEKEVQFTNLLKPICIPKDTKLREMSFVNYTPFIAGWGRTSFRGPLASHLQMVQVPVLDNELCKPVFANSPELLVSIDERVVCAGFMGGKDACQGDSGGPLMMPIEVNNAYHFYQIGVVSFGKKCAELGSPGVYTSVSHFMPWIQSKIIGDQGSNRL